MHVSQCFLKLLGRVHCSQSLDRKLALSIPLDHLRNKFRRLCVALDTATDCGPGVEHSAQIDVHAAVHDSDQDHLTLAVESLAAGINNREDASGVEVGVGA